MLALRDSIRPTTLIRSEKLRDRLRLDVTVASETFQHTGSFKFRAGYNLALNVPNDSLLTASSGNFGQALARSAKMLGKRCTVVMPQTSAEVKIDAVRGYGATVDLIDVRTVGRQERVEQLAAEMPDAYIASPYDDRLVIEGNASLGSELQAETFDAVVAPVGGGGLLSGLITALRSNGSGGPEIYGAEPLAGNDAARSLKAGELLKNDAEPQTIADGARTVSLGNLNWPIIRDGATDIIEIPEETIAEALRLHFELTNLKCEPTGALSLGALLVAPERFRDKKVCVVVSGANVDPDIYRQLLTR
jgi:threonine dehydratase